MYKHSIDTVLRIGTPDQGYYVLAEKTVKECFSSIRDYQDKDLIARQGIQFSKGRICQSWCDLAGVNHDRVMKAIEKYNEKYLRGFKFSVKI